MKDQAWKKWYHTVQLLIKLRFLDNYYIEAVNLYFYEERAH